MGRVCVPSRCRPPSQHRSLTAVNKCMVNVWSCLSLLRHIHPNHSHIITQLALGTTMFGCFCGWPQDVRQVQFEMTTSQWSLNYHILDIRTERSIMHTPCTQDDPNIICVFPPLCFITCDHAGFRYRRPLVGYNNEERVDLI